MIINIMIKNPSFQHSNQTSDADQIMGTAHILTEVLTD